MASASPGSYGSSRLDSWKEIAGYLNRDVRTVIRWEKERQLPVHRLPGGKQHGVFAYREEIDSWLLGKSGSGLEQARKRAFLPRFAPLLLVTLIAGLAAAVVWTRVNQGAQRSSHIHSLAVLPLQNLSGDLAQDYLSDGLTEALITDLAQIRSLRVVSRTSVMQYKKSTKPLPRIADELGIDGVVEGSVLRANGRVHITVQIVKAHHDDHLWAATFEGNPNELLALQHAVSRAVVQAIEASLAPQEQERLVHFRPVLPDAYDLYLKGRFFSNKRNSEGFEKAVAYFKEAVRKDPNYAAAYAGLADAYILRGLSSDPARDLPLAKEAVFRALQLDDELAEAHTSLAAIKALHDWDWANSEEEFKRAIELNDNYATAHHWYASLCLGILHRDREAIAELQRAHELDPLSLPIFNDFASIFQGTGQIDRAIQLYHEIIDMDGTFAPVHYALSIAYAKKGMYRESLMALREGQYLNGELPLPLMFASGGTESDYRRALRWEIQQQRMLSRNPDFWRYDILASLYAQVGEKDLAFAALNTALDRRDPLVIFVTDWNQFGTLRSDPRMSVILHRMNLAT